MLKFRFVPDDVNIPFMDYRKVCAIASLALVVLSILLVMVRGLNFGIDFRGGTLVEVQLTETADLSSMRSAMNALDLGEVALQNFGSDRDVLIRVERQEGDQAVQLEAVDTIKAELTQMYGDSVNFRRVEFVGPKVSEQLLSDGLLAVGLALGAVLLYIWFRFEWQFGIGAIAALFHDVILTLGLFALTGLEFNLSTLAAVLTIVGYSLNDTVVVFDRVRENLRKFKKMDLVQLMNRSVNETLARTLVTSVTTLVALLVLIIVGPAVIFGFTLAMIWGIIVGTYSSIFIASSVLLQFDLRNRPTSSVADPEVEASSEQS